VTILGINNDKVSFLTFELSNGEEKWRVLLV